MAKKKPPVAGSQKRVAEFRAKKKADGYKQVCVLLPTPTIRKLDRQCNSGQSRAVVLDKLIRNSGATDSRKSVISDNNRKRFQRFVALNTKMDSGTLTKKQREEMNKIALQICYSMADE